MVRKKRITDFSFSRADTRQDTNGPFACYLGFFSPEIVKCEEHILGIKAAQI